MTEQEWNREQERVAVGPIVVGLVLFSLTLWSLYIGRFDFAALLVCLLVALTIAASIVNATLLTGEDKFGT